MSKRTLAEIFGAAALIVLSLSNAAFADRVATTVITNLSSALSPVLSQNLAVPVASLPVATTTGSVSVGTIYFEVVATDGTGGTTIGSNLLATTTVYNSAAYNLTWPAIQGAAGYRIYFSTTTPVALTQYFNSTSTIGTTMAYNFTSTSSPVFVPTGLPVTNTGYVIKVLPNGQSFFDGGNLAVGTTTPVANFQVAGTATTSTTTAEIGASGRTIGSCLKMYRTDGSAIYAYVAAGATAFTLTTTACATVSGF